MRGQWAAACCLLTCAADPAVRRPVVRTGVEGGFLRGGVEAPPDSLITPAASDWRQLPYTQESEEVGEFYRGNIEASRGDAPLDYYGAAAGRPRPVISTRPHVQKSHYYSAAKAAPLNRLPLRDAVEQRPEGLGRRGGARALPLYRRPFPQARRRGQLQDKAAYGRAIPTQAQPYKLVCYYGAWSVYRPKPLDFGVGDIDPFSCTHLIYSFAGLAENGTMVSLDPEEDITKGSYKSAVELKEKNPNLKVMIAIGGWNEGGKKYSAMVATSKSRERFIMSVVHLLEEHSFDGLDLDWEYPAASDRDGQWADKENFAKLVDELSEAFATVDKKWLLSAAVSAAKFRVDEGYAVGRLASKLDFINVMTYDLHGDWDNFADHHAPLNARDHDGWEFKSLNTAGALNYWASKGAPLEKLLLGTPFYGRSFTLAQTASSQPGAKISGPGDGGEFTEEPGFLAYYEICRLLKEGGWEEKADSDGNPYIVKGDQWVGYDTVASVKRKMEHVVRSGLGGAMVWAIDLDDYRGDCGPRWPLLSQMNLSLRPLGGSLAPVVEEEAEEEEHVPGIVAAVEAEEEEEEEEVEAAQDLEQEEEQEEDDFSCPGAGLHRSDKDCAVYYQCMGDGSHFRFPCPAGLLYDPAISACNWPEEVDCSLRRSATARSACSGLADGLYSDPHRATHYFLCSAGARRGQACPGDTHFDSTSGRCREKEHATFHPGVVVRAQQQASSPLLLASPDKKVVCYFSNWAGLRPGDGKFLPEHLDSSLCSHVVYAFARLDEERLVPAPSGPKADLDAGYYRRLLETAGRANPSAKVLLALGGWADSAGDKYSRLVGSPAARAKFVTATVAFLQQYGFQGLVLEWHFPVCWQSDCTRGPASDRAGLASLAEELQAAFAPAGLTLAATLSGYREVIDKAYDVPRLSQALDFLNIMTYDWRGYWDGKTGHHAPLLANSQDQNQQFNVDSVMGHYEALGAPKNKLVLGIPFYGQSFTTRAGATGYGVPVSGAGKAGRYTQQKGMLAYHEICSLLKSGGLQGEAATAWRGPYAHGANGQWVSYDDTASVGAKAEMVKTKGWAGAALWTLDLDDFNNLCCGGVSPLLNTVSRALRGVGEVGGGCGRPAPPVTPAPLPATTTERYDDGSLTSSAPPAPPVAAVVAEGSTARPTTQRSTTTHRSTTSGWEDYQWTPQDYDQYEYSGEWAQSSTPTSAATSCREGQHYPDPQDCQKYFQCLNGQLNLQACAGGLYWNQDKAMCDWADGTACQVPREVETGVVVEGEGEVGPGACEPGQYSGVAGDCSAFYQCVGGERILKHCKGSLHWNNDKKVCDWADGAGCQDGLARTQEDGTGCQEGVLSGDPASCPGYFMCVHGKQQQFHCQAGTHWDDAQKVCNHPEFVGCTLAGGVPLATTPSTSAPAAPSTAANEAQVDNEDGDYQQWKPSTEDYEYVPWTPSTTTWSPNWASHPEVSPLSGDFKVVCYFTNWAWYRPGVGKYKPEDIDPTLCTHIIYGFAVLDSTRLEMKPHDSWADIDNNFYKKVTEFKKYGIKVSVAIGGWNDSKGDKYSRLVNSPAARRKFIINVIKFIEEWGFDGLDLDWEYPSCWQTECKEDRYKDQAAFAAWVRELKEAFRPKGLLLSAAVSPSKKIIEVGYDVPSIARDLDWINVMTYDYHGHWDKKTGHVAPFSEHPEDDFFYFNLKYTVDFWLEQGAPAKKLVVGMPLYGQAFTLDSAADHGLNAPARRKGAAGQFTRAAGFLAYYEICNDIKQGGWTVVKDPEGRMGPYAYKDRQWVGYDDVATIRRKSEYVRERGLGGGMVWALDLDDFKNRCGEGAHPLMKAMTSVLGPARGLYSPTAASEAGQTSASTPKPAFEPIVADYYDENEYDGRPDGLGETQLKVAPKDGYKVVCYFTNWAWYRPGTGKYKPENIQADLCTHIVYGFAVLDPGTLTIRAHDSWADFDNEFYKQVTAFKSKGKKPKVLLALGGWNDSKGGKYSKLVSSSESRRKFIKHAVDFLTRHNFDGLDLDWEYPKCWQVDCSAGPATDKENFATWVRELHLALEPKGLLLTAAVSPSNKVMDEGYNITALDSYLDYVSVMTYDYHGQWDKQTGHVAPMFGHEDDNNVFFNTNYTVNYWLQGGLRKSKLIMGMPMYGQSFTLESAGKNGLNSKTYGGGTAGRFTRAQGFLAYYEICDYVLNQGWTVVTDPSGTMGPYAYKGKQWVSFDDAKMIRFKSRYVKEMGLGGAMIWALDLDDFKNVCGCESHTLLKTINRELRGLAPRGEDCSLRGNYRSGGTGLELSPSPYSLCPQGPFKPDPSSCSGYLECDALGNYISRSCPGDLHWNRDHCDWPTEDGKCEVDAEVEVEVSPGLPEAVIAETQQPVQGHRPGGHVDNSEVVVEPVPVPEGLEVPDTGKKVVCYYTNWAWYRQGVGKYKPEDIDWTLCTHINYGFAILDPITLEMRAHDSWADIDNNFYTKVSALKEKGVVVAIALGGWNDSEGDKYSRMVSSATSRANFIKKAVQFIEKWDFQGLDLDWEYPKCWQVDCSAGPATDKENFAALVRELRAQFSPRGWILSAAVSPSKTVIDEGYDIPALSRDLDIINVMTYDYHGHWDKKTGHVAPLYEHPDDEYYYFNSNFTMHYWAQQGADKKKLVMGMPMYGQSFTLASGAAGQGLNSPAPGRGQPGEFTRAGGFLAYYEICHKVRSGGWHEVRDPQGRIGPVVQAGDQWVGYDDITTIRRKAQFVKDNGFGGGMIWALDLDDFSNRCGCENYPLLRTINRVLRDYPSPDPQCDGPSHLRGLSKEEQELANLPAALPYTVHTPKSELPTIQLGELFQ